MLHRFKNILLVVPLGAEDTGLIWRAAQLARNNKGRLTLADVVEPPPHSHSSAFVDDPEIPVAQWMRMHRLLVKSREQRLQDLALPLKKIKNLSVGTRLFQGRPSVEITRDVINSKRDLLIKPATPEWGAIEALFGGLDTQLIRQTPCPVWIVKPKRRKPYRRILAAVDPDPSFIGQYPIRSEDALMRTSGCQEWRSFR